MAALEGEAPLALVHRVNRPRGGNQRAFSLPFEEAIQVALWDLAAKQQELPLHKLLGSRRSSVRAYASGLDYHLSDDDFVEFFGHADSIGYNAFKIKVGHPDFERDLHVSTSSRRPCAPAPSIMIDANEAWGAKEALVKLTAIRDAGFTLMWVEDPILRNDFDGTAPAAQRAPLDADQFRRISRRRRQAPADARRRDRHPQRSRPRDRRDADRLACGRNGRFPSASATPSSNSGCNMACALPEVEWLEYSFQNFDHLVEQPIEIRDGWVNAPDRPGHGLVLSEARVAIGRAREFFPERGLGPPPFNPRIRSAPPLAADMTKTSEKP